MLRESPDVYSGFNEQCLIEMLPGIKTRNMDIQVETVEAVEARMEDTKTTEAICTRAELADLAQ